MYTLDDDQLQEFTTVKQLRFTALTLSLASVSILREFVELFHIERLAVQRPVVIKLVNKTNVVILPRTSADADLPPKNQ